MQLLNIFIIKSKSQLRIPRKASFINADMQTQTQTICQKGAPKKRFYSKHFCFYWFLLALKSFYEYLFLHIIWQKWQEFAKLAMIFETSF